MSISDNFGKVFIRHSYLISISECLCHTLLYRHSCSSWWTIFDMWRIFRCLGQIIFIIFSRNSWWMNKSISMRMLERIVVWRIITKPSFSIILVEWSMVGTPVFLEVSKLLWISQMVADLNLILVLLVLEIFSQFIFESSHLSIYSCLHSVINNFLDYISKIEWNFI